MHVSNYALDLAMLYHAPCNGYNIPIANFKSIRAHEDNVISSALGYIMHSPLACAYVTSCTIASSKCVSLKDVKYRLVISVLLLVTCLGSNQISVNW